MRTNWLTAVLLFHVLASAIWVFQAPEFTSDLVSLRLRLVSARSFCLVAMLVFFVQALSRGRLAQLARVFELLALIDAALVLKYGYGFLNSPSMDMTFIMTVYPIILFSKGSFHRPRFLSDLPDLVYRGLLVVIPVCALVVTPGSTAFFVLMFGTGSYFLIRKEWEKFVMLFAAMFISGFMVNAENIVSHSGRIDQWELLMKWWYENSSILWGTGTGTFQWLGPLVQNKTTNLFIWMHNEYLQILFEQGAIGLLLTCALVFVCLKRSFKVPWLFAVNVGFMMAMLTQFPLRFLTTQILALFLIRTSLEATQEGVEK